MAAPGTLTSDELVAATKQAVANQDTGLYTSAWYLARVNSGYARLTTFQGLVLAPGMRRPQFRALRFFELYADNDRALTTTLFTSSNFVTPTATSAQVVYVDNLYDRTNNKPLERKSIRYMNSRDPEATGVPRVWCPGGKAATGYYVYPIASVTAEEINVRERTYQYPSALAAGSGTPVIPPTWHAAIWLAAAAEAASLMDWSEKAAEMEQRFMAFIAERRSPVEESGAAGGRRHFNVGGSL